MKRNVEVLRLPSVGWPQDDAPYLCSEFELDVEEGLVEVGDDVFDVFDADGQAN